jgi:hypothetical protein
MTESSFYVGWMQNMPRSLSRFIIVYVVVLCLVVAGVSILLALAQKPFSKSNFEYGKTTVVTGVYFSSPVPHLLAHDGSRNTMIVLVGYGKHGAAGVMERLEVSYGAQLSGKKIDLRGTLIYGDGKTLMQVDLNDRPLVAVSRTSANIHSLVEKDKIEIKGEIIDPKCFFGVMKPGEGKVHKDCAIRCIAGGIPPVLKITTAQAGNDYILLTKSDGNINRFVLDHIATPVTLSGRLSKLHDWLVLDVQTLSEASRN